MISRATAADLDDIRAALRRVQLPATGLEEDRARVYLIRRNDRLQGVIGYDDYAPYAVLRAFVTISRRQGHGRRLLHHVLREIYALGFEAAYALTTTIPDWLQALGFVEVSAADLPPTVRQSPDFSARLTPAARCFRIDRPTLARCAD